MEKLLVGCLFVLFGLYGYTLFAGDKPSIFEIVCFTALMGLTIRYYIVKSKNKERNF